MFSLDTNNITCSTLITPEILFIGSFKSSQIFLSIIHIMAACLAKFSKKYIGMLLLKLEYHTSWERGRRMTDQSYGSSSMLFRDAQRLHYSTVLKII